MPLWTRTKKPTWTKPPQDVVMTPGGHVPYNTNPGWLLLNPHGYTDGAELLVCLHPNAGFGYLDLESADEFLLEDSTGEDDSRIRLE